MKPLYTFFLAILLLAVSAAHAAEKRVALVIGNSAYLSSRLDNPLNDATAMAATFRRLGFEVDLVTDATKANFDAAQKRFAAKADKAEAAVLFYAGHGIQANNFNYLVPIDAKPQSERDLKREMVKLDDIIDDMGAARVKLVFFDACRDNPLARSFSRGGSRGMAAPNEASGTLISFATKHGNTASDGDGKHSPYTEALLAALESPTEEVHALLRKKVQEAVKKKSGGQQEPWAYGNLNGDFYFVFTGPTTVNVQPSAPPAAATRIKTHAEREEELWDSIKDTSNVDVLNEYLKAYPQGRFVNQARIFIIKLKNIQVIPLASAKPESVIVKTEIGDKEYRVRHILTKNQEEAKDIISKLNRGEMFVKLAEKSLDTGSKNVGGDLGWRTPAMFVQPFRDAMIKLRKGNHTTEPVQTDFGWHVLMLEDVRDL